MELHGSLVENLQAAVNSARRLREKPVYPETIAFWESLAAYAWHDLASHIDAQGEQIRHLAEQLEAEIALRREAPPR